MKQFLVFLTFLISTTLLYSQDKPGTPFAGSLMGDPDICPKSSNYLTPQDIINLVTQMLEKLGIKNRYIIKECPQIDNCQATLFKGKPYILYNPQFLNKVKRLNFSNTNLPGVDDKDWETLTILAHELGHHINNHLINPEPEATQRDMELEADETAGFIIYLMGGSLLQAQLAYYNLNVSEKGDYEHPPRKQRLVSIVKGWNDAAKKYPKQREIISKDKDGDGTLDEVDKCPDLKGLASLNGCPDRDSDGIADKDDYCPDVPGVANFKGCPIPDSDNDGINDFFDKCVNIPGISRYQGCPIPDTDNDGVNDEEDNCIHEKGTRSNSGCPEKTKLNFNTKEVFFANGSDQLLAQPVETLNEIVDVLKSNPSVFVYIEGNSDNTENEIIAKNRAIAVMKYFVRKGITNNRLIYSDNGSSKPLGNNNLAAGRARNRRVDIKIK